MRDFSILDAAVIATATKTGATAIIVYAVLDLNTDDDGICNPSKAEIGQMIGLKPRTVGYAITELENAGLIETMNINGNSNQYRLIPRAGRKNIAIPSHTGGKNIAEGQAIFCRGLESDSLYYKKERKINVRSRAAYSPSFEQFWNYYPKKVGKKGAFREWQKAVKDTPVEAIIKAAEVYSLSDKAQSPYCWNPQTWLSQGHWEDDPTSWNNHNGNGNGHALRLPVDDRDFIVSN